MTNDTIVLVIGFASSTLASLFAAWKGEQTIRTIALRVKEETLAVAVELSHESRKSDATLNKKLDKSIELTIVGNDIKADILRNQTLTEGHASLIKEIQSKTSEYRKDNSDQLNRIEDTDINTNKLVQEINSKT